MLFPCREESLEFLEFPGAGMEGLVFVEIARHASGLIAMDTSILLTAADHAIPGQRESAAVGALQRSSRRAAILNFGIGFKILVCASTCFREPAPQWCRRDWRESTTPAVHL